MTIQQIKAERKWNEILLEVKSVGELYLTTHGLAQKVEVSDSDGEDATVTVYCLDETFAVEELGMQWYRLRYKDGFVGYPLESKQLSIGD